MPGNFTATVTPGKVWAESGDLVTIAALNQTASPTVTVNGNLNQIANVSSTSPSNGHPLVYSTGSSTWGPGLVNVAYLGNGSPNAAYFLRGDGNWADPATTSSAEKIFQNTNHY